jgi:hypothetical protein
VDEASVKLRLEMAEEEVGQFSASRRRLKMLAALSTIYEEQHLLSDRSAPALHDRCPDAPGCWTNLPASARPSNAEKWGYSRDLPGCITWPWVGKHYKLGGVAVLGLNFRDSDSETTVALEYLAAHNDLELFASGRRQKGSAFPYRSMATAAALLTSLQGGRPVALPAPETLGEVLEQVVRLQLVKCRPIAKVGQRGAPSQTMCQRCPPRFLWKELDQLQPGVLVTFGNNAYRALDGNLDVRWRSQRDYLARGTLQSRAWATEVVWLPHPSGTRGEWHRGQRSLIRSLRGRPLTRETASTRARC